MVSCGIIGFQPRSDSHVRYHLDVFMAMDWSDYFLLNQQQLSHRTVGAMLHVHGLALVCLRPLSTVGSTL